MLEHVPASVEPTPHCSMQNRHRGGLQVLLPNTTLTTSWLSSQRFLNFHSIPRMDEKINGRGLVTAADKKLTLHGSRFAEHEEDVTARSSASVTAAGAGDLRTDTAAQAAHLANVLASLSREELLAGIGRFCRGARPARVIARRSGRAPLVAQRRTSITTYQS